MQFHEVEMNVQRLQAEAFIGLATALEQAGQHAEARKIWQKAKQLFPSLSYASEQAPALQHGAKTVAKAHQWEQAEYIASSIEDSACRAETLHSVSKALAKAQQWQEAERVALSIEDPAHRAVAFHRITVALEKTGHHSQAQGMLQQAKQAATSIDYASSNYAGGQAEVLWNLATSLAKAHHWQEAERVATSIVNSSSQAWALLDLATALAKAQQWQEAERIAHSIARLAHDPTPSYALGTICTSQIIALHTIALALMGAKDKQQAQMIWQQAERACLSITSTSASTRAISELVISLIEAQQWRRAESIIISISESSVRDSLQVKLLHERATLVERCYGSRFGSSAAMAGG